MLSAAGVGARRDLYASASDIKRERGKGGVPGAE
jgi:hypothetical protein